MKVAPDPVLSDVVRERLELLMAEVRPRHALPGREDQSEPEPLGALRRGPHGADGSWGDVSGRSTRGTVTPAEPPPTGDPPDDGTGARRVLAPVGGFAAQTGRRVLEFTREHLAAVVVMLLVGCGWTAYSLLQARSTPVAVAVAPSIVASPVAVPTASPTAEPSVLVHVLGAVHRPGLVELAQGSRVADAIAAAGGLARSADPGDLNLAAVVADGSQVLIGTRSRPRGEVRGGGESSGVQGGAAGPVSLNTATLAQLDTLPGVGPVTAQKIIDWRQKHGRFTAVSELQEVDGIGPKTYADIAPNVRL